MLGQAEPTMVGIAPPSAPSMRFSALSHSLFVGRGACPSRCTEPFHPHNHCKSTTIPRKSPSPLPLYECSVCFASLQLRSFRSLHRAATLCDRYRASLHVVLALLVSHPCLVSRLGCHIVWQLSAADFKHPCLKLGASTIVHPLHVYERSVGFASLQSLWAFIL